MRNLIAGLFMSFALPFTSLSQPSALSDTNPLSDTDPDDCAQNYSVLTPDSEGLLVHCEQGRALRAEFIQNAGIFSKDTSSVRHVDYAHIDFPSEGQNISVVDLYPNTVVSVRDGGIFRDFDVIKDISSDQWIPYAVDTRNNHQYASFLQKAFEYWIRKEAETICDCSENDESVFVETVNLEQGQKIENTYDNALLP